MDRLRSGLARAGLIVLAALTSACGMESGVERTDGYAESTRRADEARQAGNYEYAMPLYGRALQMNPQGLEAKSGLARVYLAVGAPDEAAALYRDILARDASADARRGLALSMISMGQPIVAERQLDSALKVDSGDYKSVNLMGMALDMQGRHAEAQARYRQGLTINPGNIALRNNLGLSLAISGDPAAALVELVPAVSTSGADGKVRQNLAFAYAMAGDFANALQYLRRDLTEIAAQRQLSYFVYLRAMPPEQRSDEVRRNPAFFSQPGRS